jgi:hypothetical protein
VLGAEAGGGVSARSYLGDGVYIELEPGEVVLSTERIDGRHWLSLGPTELMQLCTFVARADSMLALRMSEALIKVATTTVEAESKATLEEIGAALNKMARTK